MTSAKEHHSKLYRHALKTMDMFVKGRATKKELDAAYNAAYAAAAAETNKRYCQWVEWIDAWKGFEREFNSRAAAIHNGS